MNFMNRRGSGALAIVAIVLALVILAAYLIGIASRDCNSNKDCAANAYCGADFECHEYPEQIVVPKNNYVPAALILGLALILAAYIYKTGHFPKIKLPSFPQEKHGHDDEHH